MFETKINVQFDHGAVLFKISSNKELNENIINEIKELPLAIHWSDGRTKNYSMDTKLSSGRWLENINYNNELTEAKAIILF